MRGKDVQNRGRRPRKINATRRETGEFRTWPSFASFCRDADGGNGVEHRGLYNKIGSDQAINDWLVTYADAPPKAAPPPIGYEADPAAPSDAGSQRIESVRKLTKNPTQDEVRAYARHRLVELAKPGGSSGTDKRADLDAIKHLVESFGIDWKDAGDPRRPEDRAFDAGMECINESSFDVMLEQVESTLFAIEQSYARIVELGGRYIDHLRNGGDNPMPRHLPDGPDDQPKEGEDDGPKAKRARSLISRAARMVSVIQRIRRARNNIEGPPPEHATSSQRLAHEATPVLRFMSYCLRPSADTSHYVWGRPHIKMAIDHWRVETGVLIDEIGIARPGETIPNGYGSMVKLGPNSYGGAIFQYPPGHGKTDFVVGAVTRSIALDPQHSHAYVHNNMSEAEKFCHAVRTNFDPTAPAGRRVISLYGTRLDKGTKGEELRVVQKERTRSPSLMAATALGKKQGANVGTLWIDDVVDIEDRHTPSIRTKKKDAINRTWLTRLRKRGSKAYYTGYPQHEDDVMWTTYMAAKRFATSKGREGRNLLNSRMPVGGPDSKPAFFAIWPEVWDKRRLRERYKSMKATPQVWAANYMLVPITDDMQIVSKVRMFDIDDEQHGSFMQAARVFISIDPSATAESKSDRAGVVVAALGNVITETGDGVTKMQRRMRIVEAKEFHATESDMADHIVAMSRSYNVEQVYVEAKGALGRGIRTTLQDRYNLRGVELLIVGRDNKETRFRNVAGLIEHKPPNNNSVIEFAGRKASDGTLEPTDPGMAVLLDYILRFKSQTGYHNLDACVQVINRHAEDLGVRRGEFSEAASKVTNLSRKEQDLRAFARERRRTPRDSRIHLVAQRSI